MMALHARRTRSRLWALACGGTACVLAACGGSDAGNETTGTGTLQGNGDGSPTTGSGTSGRAATDEGLGDCGVDGATLQLLSPTSGEHVGPVKPYGASVIYGTPSGLYRLPVGNASAKPERIAEGDSTDSFLDGDRVGIFRDVDGTQQLTWVPLAGGAATTITLPPALPGRWEYDAARNSLFGQTSLYPAFSYLRYDLSSGQNEQFTTALDAANSAPVYSSPNALVVGFTDDDHGVLYRIDKGSSTAVELDPGFVEPFRLQTVNEDSAFILLPNNASIPFGMYRVPLNGSGPAVHVDEIGGLFSQSMFVTVTDQGTFGQDYDGRTFKVFPVGGPMAGATLFEHSCEIGSLAVDQNNLYLTVEPREQSWLLTVPRP